MKINMPISNKEISFAETANILSTTDPKGALSYFNDDFLQISGFENDELIGKNHNVVRHPEMPPAAFEGLWSTVKSRQSWMGIVKNRCKNGDHYWVDAYVSPIVRNGENNYYLVSAGAWTEYDADFLRKAAEESARKRARLLQRDRTQAA